MAGPPVGDDSARPESARRPAAEPTMLKALLRERHLQNYGMFKRTYQRTARTLDENLVGTFPSEPTFRRWLAGKIRLPHAEHCAVLEAMLPGWTITDLFQPSTPPSDPHKDANISTTAAAMHLSSSPNGEPGNEWDTILMDAADESADFHQRATHSKDPLSNQTLDELARTLPEADTGQMVTRRDLLVTSGVAAIDAKLSSRARVLHALEIVSSQDADNLSGAADCLDELVRHYSEKLPIAQPSEIYEDLVNVRSFAGSLLERSNSSTRRRSDLIAATGWLSNLLAITTSYMGDHSSSLVWCLDAERHSHDSGNRHIADWAAFNKAMIAYYQGHTDRSVELASSGRERSSIGTVAHAKLAAHEMRTFAMIGDDERMLAAKKRATTAIAELPSKVPHTGIFSISFSEDPPYTGTSLLLLNRFEEAASATERVIQTAHRDDLEDHNRRSSSYARALLILGLASAGLGDVDSAVAAGRTALESGRLVWPTLVLAQKLDRTLMHDHKSVAEVADYHDLCLSLADTTGTPKK